MAMKSGKMLGLDQYSRIIREHCCPIVPDITLQVGRYSCLLDVQVDGGILTFFFKGLLSDSNVDRKFKVVSTDKSFNEINPMRHVKTIRVNDETIESIHIFEVEE